VELVSMDLVTWEALDIGDAQRGGFNTLADLAQALKRAGYRFKPLNEYELYRIQFAWLEFEVIGNLYEQRHLAQLAGVA